MAIELIDKIKQKNGGTFKLVDSEDIAFGEHSLTEEIDSVKTQLSKKANKDDVAKISSGTPFFANSISEMTDITRNYVNVEDGYLYTYNGITFENSNVKYQSTGLDDDTKNKIDKSYGAISETIEIADIEIIKSYNSDATFTNPTQSWYGWKCGFKPISFNKLIFTEDVTVAGSTYTCQILDSNSNKLYEKIITAPNIGEKQKLVIDFGKLIEMKSDFYISITSTEFVSFIAAEGYNNTEIVSSTLKTSGWLNGTSWSELNNFSHILILDFIGEGYKVDINKVVGLKDSGDGKKQLCDDGVYRSEEEIRKIGISQETVDVIYPKYLYCVRNDVNTNRNYALGLYVDHFLDGEKIKYNSDIRFKDGTLEKKYWSGVISKNQETEKISLGFKSDKYIIPEISTTLRKSKLTPNKDKVAKILCIGDSNFYGASNISYSPYKKPFVSILKQMFELDKIDNNGIGGALLLGNARKLTFNEEYNGQNREFTACTDGRSGWTAYGFARHIKNYTPSQSTWDLLGLGNGTGRDYTGSQTQKDLIASTNQNYSDDISQSETRMLWNPYFDNSKTGNTKFSLAKYLERYRTMDDNGSRLTVGNGTGSYITSDNINDIDLCTPTHVIIQLGQNDIDVGISNSVIIDNIKAIVNSIKDEYPNMIIIIAHCDRPGTMFPNEYGYSGFDCRMVLGGHDKTKALVSSLLNEFDNESSENMGIYYCPNYFTQHNADSMDFNFIINPLDGSITNMKVKDFSNSPDAHPSSIARSDWAYQIYSIIRWSQYI